MRIAYVSDCGLSYTRKAAKNSPAQAAFLKSSNENDMRPIFFAQKMT